MRPGQTAPENAGFPSVADTARAGFNEAGANCPGKLICDCNVFCFDFLLQ